MITPRKITTQENILYPTPSSSHNHIVFYKLERDKIIKNHDQNMK